ncbi:MAG: proton-conducting membrane transporter [Candidatus Dormibacteraeota bacterium]|nr:proton-conducting membrane transporter [Candidatus Dormibacteraeota bacterium]
MIGARLLSGPELSLGSEGYADHVRRLGTRPAAGADLIPCLERSGLRGRGGASFPLGAKWRSVASRAHGAAVVLANGAEGEPLSAKDRTLMAARPHLVLDGAFLAAEAVGATEVVLYVGADLGGARSAMARALAERPPNERARARVVAAPPRYLSGEESAAVHFVNAGVALPTAVPPRPFERGVAGRRTLVQNVESLAHAALIARFGDDWFRGAGREGAAGTGLVTLAGAVGSPGVYEIELGTPVGELLAIAGSGAGAPRAVLLGGYFGAWVPGHEAPNLRLDADRLKSSGRSLGCGVALVLPAGASGLEQTAAVMDYLAGQSAAQCGPCFFGLRALADLVGRVAAGGAAPADLERLRRWSGEVRGRGACRHPDGASGFLQSALEVFEDEIDQRLQPGRRLAA